MSNAANKLNKIVRQHVMSQASANLNIMIKAARKASRGLLRDFGEVENLQVSSKAAGDFVSKADIKQKQPSSLN